MLLRHKKGVSEIVSYVILIIIAVAIGALVFNYLQVLIPKDRPECGDGVSLSINEASCDSTYQNLDLSVRNTGRFNIDASYIRIGNLSRETRYWINTEDTNQFEYPPDTMNPGKIYSESYNVSKAFSGMGVLSGENYTIEIQIAMFDEETEKYAACPEKITKTITCS
jgi:hypothetical protein